MGFREENVQSLCCDRRKYKCMSFLKLGRQFWGNGISKGFLIILVVLVYTLTLSSIALIANDQN